MKRMTELEEGVGAIVVAFILTQEVVDVVVVPLALRVMVDALVHRALREGLTPSRQHKIIGWW